eukprot:COSAG05_NODE_2170_length_3442_cov_3.273706_1_plen_42_part_10
MKPPPEPPTACNMLRVDDQTIAATLLVTPQSGFAALVRSGKQ